MSHFSGGLKLTDLDDFIAPSQECVKPVAIEKKKPKESKAIKLDDDGGYFEVSQDGTAKKLPKAKITLDDCLACSGCITTAESILISAQSQEELYRVLDANFKISIGEPVYKQLDTEMADEMENDAMGSGSGSIEGKRIVDEDAVRKIVVVSIAPQSIASLSVKYNMSMDEVARRVCFFLRSMGVHFIFDVSLARNFSLMEAQREFVRRYQLLQSQKADGVIKKKGTEILPMLASACPGWVCYAEKTHGDFIVPYISTTKSPQQIMGSLVKGYLAESIDVSAAHFYHVAVMPCFDKKLEASRQDFYNDVLSTRDVDCVITTGELDSIFTEKTGGFEVSSPVESHSFDSLIHAAKTGPWEWSNISHRTDIVGEKALAPEDSEEMVRHQGSVSGGYTEHVLIYAAKELFGLTLDELEYKTVRNKDFQECLVQKDGVTVLQGALAYGFRNIQSLVQKVKRGKSVYDYVEVMACPSGCVNGGGQIKDANQSKQKDIVSKVGANYLALPTQSSALVDPDVDLLYSDWLDGSGSVKAQAALHTEYHAVEKMTSGLTIKW
ncbi:hypothetical protein SARC_02241 [Sphaeroforma arctica JP610]|uniref:Iron hydrogenase large subunit C-terminal domain-containing protein n=1 Tax=Sphaeroforma arctica JP610 TaxID=667725 RepID=A0A0L0G9L0_9EUKA|nr:hypothetical protein SARC_02241 [Sphaeroforma arctica JP610]KNC85584.1 hypothetical protein SARC_02241 [Sphaeroforma arctica JP610]|eukprot:XP_014159486.1 hypothetical protein SARC_02241 [Sphaeroforma arctica JP610]